MKYVTSTKGYSLVEVLVAVAILMIAIVGPLTIAMKSLQSAQYARQQNTAFFLAQEGISAVNTLRNNGALAMYTGAAPDAWNWTNAPSLAPCYKEDAADTDAGCNIDFIDSLVHNHVTDCSSATDACRLKFNEDAIRAKYQVEDGTLTPYTRVITLQRSGDEVLVESRVQWESGLLGDVQAVSLTSSLFNIYK